MLSEEAFFERRRGRSVAPPHELTSLFKQGSEPGLGRGSGEKKKRREDAAAAASSSVRVGGRMAHAKDAGQINESVDHEWDEGTGKWIFVAVRTCGTI